MGDIYVEIRESRWQLPHGSFVGKAGNWKMRELRTFEQPMHLEKECSEFKDHKESRHISWLDISKPENTGGEKSSVSTREKREWDREGERNRKERRDRQIEERVERQKRVCVCVCMWAKLRGERQTETEIRRKKRREKWNREERERREKLKRERERKTWKWHDKTTNSKFRSK